MPPRSLVRHGALAAALALVVLAVMRPALAPGLARGVGALPACRYDDIMTEPRGYDDWSTTLVDTILRVPKGYVPPDLVSVAQAGLKGHGKVRAIMIDDLRSMAEAAAAAGDGIGVQSAYRSYDDQVATFAHWVSIDGYAGALKVSARPGHSEHQLGLAIDFRSQPEDATLSGSWAFTPAGKWMGRHAWEYGFVRSYPARKQAISCYASEPWHYRYVGRDLAAAIHASGLTTREYLWANFTTANVPAVTPKPGKQPPGSGGSAASVSPAASIEATGAPASAVPGSSEPASPATGAASPGPSAAARESAAPVDLSPAADIDPGAAAGIAAALAVAVVVAVLVLRRGRSGVGL